VATLLVTGYLLSIVRDRLAHLIAGLSDAAHHDPLTELLNRRGFQEVFDVELERARRADQPLSLIVGDLDRFKRVNDVHGHAAGDELLRRVAEVLRGAVRPTDRLYRWGGDEFLLLLPGARAADARRRVEELVASANQSLPTDLAERLALELSLGAAEFAGGEALEPAVSRADAAMYEEKSRRRLARAPELAER